MRSGTRLVARMRSVGTASRRPGDLGKRRGEVLEVVEEDERRLAAGKGAGDRLRRGVPRRLVDAESASDGREDELGIGDRREIDECGPADRGRSRERKGRLSGASGTGERDEADVVAAKKSRDRRELDIAADELRRTRRRRSDLRRRKSERRVVVEDALLQVPQLR